MVSRYGRNAVAVFSFYKHQGTVKLHNMRQISVKSAYNSNTEQSKDRSNSPEMACLSGFLIGARDGTRTHDLLITNQLRYQLRHSSILNIHFTGMNRSRFLRFLVTTLLLYNIPFVFSSSFFRMNESCVLVKNSCVSLS